MQFTKLVLAAAAIAVASAQSAQFTNSVFTGITVGTPFNITWSGATSDITLKLKNGPSTNQQLVQTIASGLTGTSYSWTPGPNIVDGTYNLEIDHGSDQPNYSAQFTISGGLLSSSSSAGSSTSASSTSTSTVTSATTTSTSTLSSTSGLSNSTITSKTASSTVTSTSTKQSSSGTSTSTTTSTGTVPSSNSAVQYASPFAFVLMSFVAIAALN